MESNSVELISKNSVNTAPTELLSVSFAGGGGGGRAYETDPLSVPFGG